MQFIILIGKYPISHLLFKYINVYLSKPKPNFDSKVQLAFGDRGRMMCLVLEKAKFKATEVDLGGLGYTLKELSK